jgi:hypothetical protein
MNTTVANPPARGFIVRGRGLTPTRILGLLSFAIPGAGFIAALFYVRGRPEFLFLEDVRAWPIALWLIAIGGSIASLAGVADFFWHVRGLREVSRKEERGEVVALALGGAPLFCLMAVASVAAKPTPYLLPVLIVTMFTVACVCHDEFVYHRRACGKTETLFHHVLIGGNGLAFLAWFHWIFVGDRLVG